MTEDTTFQQAIKDAGESPQWNKAEKIVDEYRITYTRDKTVGYFGSSAEIPAVKAQGKTLEQCTESTRKALIWAVVDMLETGRIPPSPQCVVITKNS